MAEGAAVAAPEFLGFSGVLDRRYLLEAYLLRVTSQ
jgi:hypothetical protein